MREMMVVPCTVAAAVARRKRLTSIEPLIYRERFVLLLLLLVRVIPFCIFFLSIISSSLFLLM
uniref:Uncharacterized protein n=1 Tax=Arundo donax TaxID=35708 RepID=A0A0A9CVZ6_ARUDO